MYLPNIATIAATEADCSSRRIFRAWRSPRFIERQPGLGFVPRNYIYGKAVFVFWPPEKIGTVR